MSRGSRTRGTCKVAIAPFSRVQISSQLKSRRHHQLMPVRACLYCSLFGWPFRKVSVWDPGEIPASTGCWTLWCNKHSWSSAPKRNVRPEVMLAISICEYIFYCGTCHSIALQVIEVRNDLFTTRVLYMCLPKLCPACFFRLHNLMFEAISVNFRLAAFHWSIVNWLL